MARLKSMLKKSVIFAIIVLVLSFVLNFPRPIVSADERSHKLALLVGISKYDRGRGIKDDWKDLHCEKDIQLLKKILFEKFGFQDQDIHVLLNEKATLDGILREFNEHLIEKARPGDIVIFHFSGHGQQIKDNNGDEIDGKDECFVPYDYRVQGVKDMKGNPRLIDDQIEDLLARLTRKMTAPNGKMLGDIIVTIDSCHSGTGARKGVAEVRGRAWDVEYDGPEPQAAKSSGEEIGTFGETGAAPDYIVFSACKTQQTAKEDPDKMGVFTKYFLKALEKAGPHTTYEELFRNMCAMMDSSGWANRQDAQVEGDLNRLVFNGQAKAPDAYLIVQPTEEKDIIKIPAGELHGVTVGSLYAIYEPGSDVNDRKNVIAEAEIKSVDLDSSKAKIIRKQKELTVENLTAAKAVEIGHDYSSQLKLLVENSGVWTGALNKMKFLNTQGVNQADYDIKIYEDGNKRSCIFENKDGSIIAEIPESEKEFENKVQSKLLGEWRRRFLRRLSNDALKVEIRPRIVRVETDPNNPMIIKKELGTEDARRDGTGRFIVNEGDWITFEIKNSSIEFLYINILELSPDGSIVSVFPGTDRIAGDIIQDEFNKLDPDEKWNRLPFKAPEKFQRQFVWKVGAPYGIDLIKVIATTRPVDFSPIVDRKAIASRGEDNLLKGIGSQLNPLARLLMDSTDGGMRGSGEKVFPENWSTADLIFEIKKNQQ